MKKIIAEIEKTVKEKKQSVAKDCLCQMRFIHLAMQTGNFQIDPLAEMLENEMQVTKNSYPKPVLENISGTAIEKEMEFFFQSEQNMVANCALARMKSIFLILENNHKLLEPYSLEQITRWMSIEMYEYEKSFL